VEQTIPFSSLRNYSMPYIQTISYEDSSGELRQVYDNLIAARGKLAEVHKIQSLNPKALLAHMEFYKAVMFTRSALKRYQREMIAVIVSAANQCTYCIEHHKEALLFYWKDVERLEKLLFDRGNAGLSETDIGLCRYAEALTLNPADISEEEIENLRSLGLADTAILDATQVVAYFNFVNRMVLALGVEFTEEETKGYNY
jgi:uncharacterized peroxidase-related enzyme